MLEKLEMYSIILRYFMHKRTNEKSNTKIFRNLARYETFIFQKKDDKKYIFVYKVNTHNTRIQKKMKNM